MAVALGRSAPAAWVVAGCALIAAIAGPFVADGASHYATPPQVTGTPQSYLNYYSGPVFLVFLFGALVPALVAAGVSYAGLALKRPRIFGVAAVLGGLLAAFVVGLQIQAIGSWWLGISRDTNHVAAVVGAVVSLVAVSTLALSVKFPILRSALSQRGVLAALLGLSVLSGLFIGLLVGGEAAGITALQYGCPPTATSCYGPGIESAMEEGAIVGTWVGGAMGVAVGLVVWAVPPRRLAKGSPAASDE